MEEELERSHDLKDQDACCETVPSRQGRDTMSMKSQHYGFLNKTRIMTKSVDPFHL